MLYIDESLDESMLACCYQGS